MELSFLKITGLSKLFTKNKIKSELDYQETMQENSKGISQEEYDSFLSSSKVTSMPQTDNFLITTIDFSQLFESKQNRVAKYREMSLYPEIGEAIDYVCDDAIVPDDDGKILDLTIQEEIPKAIEKKIRDIWNDTLHKVFKIKETGRYLFKKWLVESELYLELVLNEKKNDILGVKILPSFTMAPIYQGANIVAFKQTISKAKSGYIDKTEFDFESNQIVYANYGDYGENLLDVRGYMELSVRTYNQLKNLEDALIVYRLVRAPERRVWNIATGKMPKTKAEEYIRGLINRFKKKQIYDPETGKVDSSANVQALTEDFWFAKADAGDQTTVSTIGGNGSILGQMDDVNYFLKKLYKSLKLPRSRWDENYVPTATYGIGRIGEVTREEVKFARFVGGMQNRFKFIIMDTFMMKLKLNKIDEKYIDKNLFDIQFTESNLFKEFKEMEITQARFGLFSQAYSYIKSAMNPEGMFAKEFVLRRYFKMSDEDYNENMKLLKIQEAEDKKKQAEMGGGQFGQGPDQFGVNGQPGGFDQGQGGEPDNPVDRFNNFSQQMDQQGQENPEGQPKEEESASRKKVGKKQLLTSSANFLKYVESKIN